MQYFLLASIIIFQFSTAYQLELILDEMNKKDEMSKKDVVSCKHHTFDRLPSPHLYDMVEPIPFPDQDSLIDQSSHRFLMPERRGGVEDDQRPGN